MIPHAGAPRKAPGALHATRGPVHLVDREPPHLHELDARRLTADERDVAPRDSERVGEQGVPRAEEREDTERLV